ncbi:GW dipeptide domain-containing protein [Virgibacillus sp. LDC-1]|uniref:GW dipeptide domain-containing protein n=1 Tax=Virgibacillus sp. LDC-1 TaxID=3039856 RepID=UPI0024DEA23D|nr:GW dipeptide domain-containing protein [Virgibacillus sp. LDC-1]
MRKLLVSAVILCITIFNIYPAPIFQHLVLANSIIQTDISRVGQIYNQDVSIYKTLGDSNSQIKAGLTYTDQVFFIKKQARVNNELYYLISTEASSIRGVIGWVKAKDFFTLKHIGVDNKAKEFYFKGTGVTYSKIWGGKKNIVHDSSSTKSLNGQLFKVNLTQNIEGNIWYRGTIPSGQEVWIHSSHVLGKIENPTSRVGQIYNQDVSIYKTLGDPKSKFKAGTTYTDQVFFIKKQARINNELFYLISTEASSVRGVIGWVKATDFFTLKHIGVDNKAKEFYLKGTGVTYSKIWGGKKNIVHDSSSIKGLNGQLFRVNLTQNIEGNIWYRGISLDGQEVWIHSSHLDKNESLASRVGQIYKQDVSIYKTLGDPKSKFRAGTTYTDQVFFIKKQARINKELYYLISTEASSKKGVIGWVKATDIFSLKHTGVDNQAKEFYFKGNGVTYSKIWGGKKNVVHDSSSIKGLKGQLFKVNLTQNIEGNIWYRGTTPNGQEVWIHSSHVLEKIETPISRVGQIYNEEVTIHKTLGDPNSQIKAGATYTDQVFFIKKQAQINDELFYLISTEASSVRGVIGWVKATDFSTLKHIGVDNKPKEFYIEGNGVTYSKIWGGKKNIVHDSSSIQNFKGQLFKVNLTQNIEGNIWYRGTLLNGQEVWIHSSHVLGKIETPISRVGQIYNEEVTIHKTLGDPNSQIKAGATYTDQVFFIKKQAKIIDELFYLISTEASSERGVIGWVKATDFFTLKHIGVDNKAKEFYIEGNGVTYSKIWGGKKNIVHDSSFIQNFKDELFKVNLTQNIDGNIWYRGTLLNGQEVWIHSSHVYGKIESPTSRLGQISNQNVTIHKTIGDPNAQIKAGTTYTDTVLYIKKQAQKRDQLYYLISMEPSSTNGVIGWVNATDIFTLEHTTIDKIRRTFYFKGTGVTYSKIWGGKKNIVHDSTSIQNLKGQAFKVNLTENVGGNTWYHGTLQNGQSVWIHSSHLDKSNIQYTNYSVTFNEALNRQMNTTPPPQTDKYRNKNAFIHNDFVNITSNTGATTTGSRLRTEPRFTDTNTYTTVSGGTLLTIVSEVTGDTYSGSNKWYKVIYSGKTLYIHTSLVNPNVSTAVTTATVNIRDAASTNSHIYGTVPKGTTIKILKKGTTWHEISYNAWRNAKSTDVREYLDPNKNDRYQHLLLSGSAGVSEADLRKVLLNKGTLNNTQKSFISASKTHNVNEVYLIAHALHETGNGSSTLAKGVRVGKDRNGNLVLATSSNSGSLTSIKTVYNMYGIAAYDSNPLLGGAKKAYQLGWTTVDRAIIGGAKWISDNYINHAQYKQNTLYKMKWNPSSPGSHQYATDIGWSIKQISKIKNVYDLLPNAIRVYDIPKYR